MASPQQTKPNPMAKNPVYTHHQEQKPCPILPENKVKNEFYPSSNFPKGYRFMPTDEELITYYLKERINNQPIPIEEINDADLYQHSPHKLAGIYPNLGQNEWYFFTPRDRKYPNGVRPNRAAGTGYWKATGADKSIFNDEGEAIGFRKALVFYEGKPSKGVKSNWIMHEYRVNQPPRNKRNAQDMRLDDWVMCRIYLKTKKTSKKQPVDVENEPVDSSEVASEENTAAIDNNLEEIIQEQHSDKVDAINPSDGLVNNSFVDFVPQTYENAIVQGTHLMEDSSLIANYNHQSNIDFHEGAIPYDEHVFTIQNLIGNNLYINEWDNNLDYGNHFAPTNNGSSGTIKLYDFKKTEEAFMHVPLHDPDVNQSMPRKRRM